MKRNEARLVEGSLLLFAFVILALGALLVYLAKMSSGLPSGAVNLNDASAEGLALTLELDPQLADRLVAQRTRLGGFDSVAQVGRVSLFPSADQASRAAAALAAIPDVNTADASSFARVLQIPHAAADRIVAYRAARPGGRFTAIKDVLRTPIVDPAALSDLGPRLYVRSPVAVSWRFFVVGLACLVLFLVAAIAVRRSASAADPYLIPISALLGGLGVLLLFSARDPLRDAPLYDHHAAGLWLGLAALAAGALMPARVRRSLRRYTYVWALAAFALVLALLLFGRGPGGVRINLGFFQPIEIVKLLVMLFLAAYLTDRGDLLSEALHRWRPPLPKGIGARWGIALPRWADVGPMLGMFAAALLMFTVVKEMGPALLLFAAFVTTLYIATGRAGIVWSGLVLALLGAAAAYAIHLGFFAPRVDMWLSPWHNTHKQGMQLGQALWGMSSGGEEGSGLGLGALAQPGALPVVESDLIFAGAAEELGLVGALAMLTLYVVIVWRGAKIAASAQNDFDRLLAAALTTLFAWQVYIILAGVTGLIPLTGITLPFMARGNTSLVADYLLLGLLMGVSASAPATERKPVFQRTSRHFAVGAAALLLGVVGVRLFWIQAIAADATAGRLIRTPDADGIVRAKINPRLIAVERAIQRGSIYDRNGRVLATSRLDEMTSAIGDAAVARRRRQRGARYYPLGAMAAHVVGYADPTVGGPVGIEKDYDGDLRGFHDYSDLLPDYRNHITPRRGQDVTLTIDAAVQETAYQLLKRRVSIIRDKAPGGTRDSVGVPYAQHRQSAALVVLDPSTGAVLASVSLPSFDPNTLTPASLRELQLDPDRGHPLLDRARAGYYPPGSTLKVATAAAGLEAGLDPAFDCEHTMQRVRWTYAGKTYGRRAISDDVHDPSHGELHMARALAVSCNLYFATLGLQLGTDRLYHAFADRDRWAFSRVAPPDRFAPDLPLNAFGQGTMVVTATEMARTAAAVANQGLMMWPYYSEQPSGPSRAASPASTQRSPAHPLTEQNAAALAAMMRGVVQSGTAAGVFDGLPVQVAGKTGTAQTDQGDRQPHSWFIGFAPYDHPQYAFSCVIENGGYGKRGAAPVIRDLLASIYGK